MTPRRPDLTWRCLTVWYRDWKVWKTYIMPSLVGDLGEPLLYLFSMGFGLGALVGSVDGQPYMSFLAPGLICSTAMYAATFECTFGAFTRMTKQYTYDAILSTPVSLDEIVTGEILWGATKSLFSGLSMLLVIALFGLVRSPWTILAVPVIFLLGLIFASLAMIVSARSPSYDFFSYYFTLVIAPMFLFSGIFFPVESLPAWMQPMAWALPLTHGVDLLRALFTGAPGWRALGDLLALGAFLLAAFLLALRFVRKRLIL